MNATALEIEPISDLFAELVEGIPTAEEYIKAEIEAALPKMPQDLEEFDREIKRDETRFEGFISFLYVLRSQLRGGGIRDELLSQPAACDSEDPRGTRDSRGNVILLRSEKQAAFDADFPHPEDYDDSEHNADYQAALRATEIGMAHAKRICMTACPMQRVCLAAALVEGSAYRTHQIALEQAREIAKCQGAPVGPTDEFYYSTETVRGGWGPGARVKILNSFNFWRRAYEQSAIRLGYEADYSVPGPQQAVEEIDWPAFASRPLNNDKLTIEELQAMNRLALTII